jgi:hypothetical protein
MTLYQWLIAVVDGMMGDSRGGRKSVWSRCSTAAKEAQGLEARCLLSGDPLSEQSALTTVDMNSLSSMFDAGLIQINAIRMHDFSSLSPAPAGQIVYGPIFPATASLPGPTEDLYDEGAGAVWGSLADEGARGTDTSNGSLRFGEADGTGAMGMNDMLPQPDMGDYGAIGVNDGPIPDMGDYGAMVDGLPNPDTGDFPNDNGIDATGVADWGFDDLGGVLGYDDGGFDVNGADTGAADGAADTQINIQVPDAEAWEGPYRVSKLDEAKFVLNVTGGTQGSPFNVTVSFTGTATPGIDYRVIDRQGQPVKFITAIQGGVTTANINGGVGSGDPWFKIIAMMDGDYELQETVIVTIVAGFGYEIGELETATAVIEDRTGDLDINGLNEDIEDKPGADIRLNDDDDNEDDKPDYLDGIHDIYDNDLVPVSLTSHLRRDNDYAPVIHINDFPVSTISYLVLQFDPTKVRVYQANCETVIPGGTTFPEVEGLTLSFLLEGVGMGVGSIALEWIVKIDDEGGSLDGNLVFSQALDTVKYTVWGLDLDVDSDNNNGFNTPDNSMWEEYLEPNEYAIGKMLSVNNPQFTPVVIQLPAGLDPHDGSVFLTVTDYGGRNW